jgi:HEAT repeat protein
MNLCDHQKRPLAGRLGFAGALVLLLALSAMAAPTPTVKDLPRLVREAAAIQTGQGREAFGGLERLVRESVSHPALRGPVEAGLIQLLAPAATFQAKGFACRQLGIVGGNAALPALAALLRNPETAGLACLALTTYSPGKADKILREALASATGVSRLQLLTTLGDRRDRRAVALLARQALDPDLDVAEAAIAALGKVGDQTARKAIAALRHSARPDLTPALTEAALRCAEALSASGERAAALAAYKDLLDNSDAPFVRRAALEALLRLDEEGREARILAALEGMDSILKPSAIAAVRTLPASISSEPFVSDLHNLTPLQQTWMIDSLAALNDPSARLAICVSLASPEKAVRLAAVEALGKVGDPSLVPMFANALAAAKNAEESKAIQTALVNLKGGAAVDKAITAEVKHCSGKARAGLLAVLARRMGSAANPVLFGEIQSKDPVIAKAAFRALAKTAEEGDAGALVEAVANVHDRDVRPEAENAAGQALLRIKNVTSRSALVRATLGRARTIASRRALLRLLPECADERALAALQIAVGDPEPPIRDAAVRALAEWPDDSAWKDLAGLCSQAGDPTVRGLALRGLVRLAQEENVRPDTTLIGRYHELIECARTDDECKLVLGAMAGAAHPDALPLAEQLLARPGARPEAEVAIRKIAEAVKDKYPDAAKQALQKIQPAK